MMIMAAGGLDSFALAGMSFMDMGTHMGVGDGDGDGGGRNNGHAHEQDQERAQRQFGNVLNAGNAGFSSSFA
jgi:hypothetical protein